MHRRSGHSPPRNVSDPTTHPRFGTQQLNIRGGTSRASAWLYLTSLDVARSRRLPTPAHRQIFQTSASTWTRAWLLRRDQICCMRSSCGRLTCARSNYVGHHFNQTTGNLQKHEITQTQAYGNLWFSWEGQNFRFARIFFSSETTRIAVENNGIVVAASWSIRHLFDLAWIWKENPLPSPRTLMHAKSSELSENAVAKTSHSN